MKNSSIFQTILLVVCGGALVVAVLIFGGILPGFRAKPIGVAGQVTLWGTIDVDKMFEDLNKANKDKFQINYVKKDPARLNTDLLEALAKGGGPDAIILPHELVFRNWDKLYPVPLTSLSNRQFRDIFVDGADLFATPAGYLALPVAIDPLVLYYNKDIYTANNLITPPTNWEEFVSNQPKLTVIDNLKRLKQSATAMGTANNINNAKDIFTLLSFQTGSTIASFDGANFSISLGQSDQNQFNPSQMSLDFYLQFADPTKSTYTWSRTMPEARDAFIAGNLANYFGLASELPIILAKNPHLNFDVAPVPRLDKGSNITFGRFYGLAVLKRSAKISPAFAASFALALNPPSPTLAEVMGLAPARRTAIATGNSDPLKQVFYKEALACRAWADFDPEATDKIIRQMINSAGSGQLTSANAVKKAGSDMGLLLSQ